MPTELDEYEKRILAILQVDSSRSNAEVAKEIGLSEAPCWRRTQRLKKEGYISAQVSLLDRRKVGLNTHVFALVKLSAVGRSNLSEFSEAIRQFPEVLDCYVLMGSADFMLRIVTRDIDAYEQFFFDKLSKLPGIQDVNSMVALSEIKSTTRLPLETMR
ncbi:Lrp/AsnC family transcriptional regulator [Novosphingobium album (ex Liu et al. 2023)]|uniref:Lrp/AsnC family transcriptional regulator n=1 Tax=Novosphingobium album (ex Liu et al. 2023) TaxID=3031130 RepID=A0ABT5WJI3_9SPHN|nr:Lrp/AsnC family transcriptional regulator [Novosphingobium album (ex Liu et al. 2023)]MDE8650195.1 Lrp/AsnC family transcriptional regulator [Novosphingobium album (ex Liu et al. 2023)]